MIITKNRGVFFLVLFLAVVVVVLFCLRLLAAKPAQINAPSPTPRPVPTRVLFLPTEIIAKLPIDNENYSVQYFSQTDQFFVLIKKNPYFQFKKEVLAWFASFGVKNPEKELNLFFTSTPWVGP
jgi:hypothetical protein